MTFLKFFVLALSTLLVACDGGDSSSDAGADAGDDTNAECSDADMFDTSQCPDAYPNLECVVYVDGDVAASGDGWSWATAVKTAQEGIDLAHCGAEVHGVCEQWQVWVKKGTYFIHKGCREHTVRLRQGVMLLGGFAGNETSDFERDWETNVTTLDGRDGPEGANHVYHVVTGSDSATLDGLTVTGGNADNEDQNSIHSWGGGMLNDSASPLIANCIFKDNSASVGGGIENFSSSPTVTNCVFENNSALLGGGMDSDSGSPNLTDCVFKNNSALLGGGMEVQSASTTVTDCVFEDNSAIEGGGMDIDTNSSVSLDGCSFIGNSAKGDYPYGGAISVLDSQAFVNDSAFTGNSADDSGGAIMVAQSFVEITGSDFSANSAVNDGGGITCQVSECNIEDSTFSSNNAEDGGAMVLGASTGVVSGCSFSDNEAEAGGGIAVLGQAELQVIDTLFASNGVTYCGGGIHVEESVAKVEGCAFEENYGAQFGGGINCIDFSSGPSVCEISDSTLASNTSLYGGGMYLQNSTTTLSSVLIQDNTADSGGGIYMQNSTASAFEVMLAENEATYVGGGMCQNGGVNAVSASRFSNNTAIAGGGVFMQGGESEIQNSLFYANTATNVGDNSDDIYDGGGGIYGRYGAISTISNCTFFGNTAMEGAGAVESDSSEGDPVETEIDVVNSILFGNSPKEIDGDLILPSISYSNLAGGAEGEGNIDADPLFVDSENGDLHLQAGSPCIGAANPDAGVETDIEGNPRDDEPDMGAYEYLTP